MSTAKILWVDDEIDSLTSQILFLENKGYDVTTKSNGFDAIEYVKDNVVDVVLMDESMPGLTGLQTLQQIKEIVDEENKIQKRGLPKDYNEFNRIKSIGFSDKKLSEITKISEDLVRKKRTALKVLPVYKKVDTCAAEFKSFTPYMYSTYQRNYALNTECEAEPSSRKKIIILGGSGYVGSAIISFFLNKKIKVINLDNLISPSPGIR